MAGGFRVVVLLDFFCDGSLVFGVLSGIFCLASGIFSLLTFELCSLVCFRLRNSITSTLVHLMLVNRWSFLD